MRMGCAFAVFTEPADQESGVASDKWIILSAAQELKIHVPFPTVDRPLQIMLLNIVKYPVKMRIVPVKMHTQACTLMHTHTESRAAQLEDSPYLLISAMRFHL